MHFMLPEKEGGNLIIVYLEKKKELESIFPKELSEKMLAVVKENIESNMEYAINEAKKAGIPAEKIVLSSEDIGGDLIRIAEEKAVDLTVMGSESLRRDPPWQSHTLDNCSRCRTRACYHQRGLRHSI